MITAWRQTQYWQDSTSLFEHALEVTGDNIIAHSNLGFVKASQGQLEEAVAHYLTALRIDPEDAEAHDNFGVVLEKQGKPEEAIAHYAEALTQVHGQKNIYVYNLILASGRHRV
jgi:Tfp pilus assembly protein PilF